MPSATQVVPRRWKNIEVLYDDGDYSCIWGDYTDSNGKQPRGRLGVRWNGAPPKLGYPSQGKNPVWYIEPDFLVQPVLAGLRASLLARPESPQLDEYIKRIDNRLNKP